MKPRGFSLSEIIERKEDFIESLASYGLFVVGSSGVQAEWPKLLLTQGYDGFFYLDLSLPDQLEAKHWLVKFICRKYLRTVFRDTLSSRLMALIDLPC